MRIFFWALGAVRRWPRRTLFILALCVFALVTPGNFDEADTEMRLQVTRWLWANEPQMAPRERPYVQPPSPAALYSPGWCPLRGKNGETFAQFSLGQSIVMIPADILSYWMAENLFGGRMWTRSFVVNSVTFSILSAAAVVLSYEALLLLGFSSAVALAATTLLLIGTTFLPYIQVMQENLLMYFCYIGSLVFVLRGQSRAWRMNFAVAGVLAGFNLLIKLTNVVFLPVIGILAVWVRLQEQGKPNARPIAIELARAGIYLGAPVLFFVGVDRYYQYYRFGELLSTFTTQMIRCFGEYGYPQSYPFGHNVIDGLLGPLVRLDKSIFLFDPFLISACVLGVLLFRRLTASQAIVFFGSALALAGLVASFSTTYFWTGGAGAWGPRHYLVPVQAICLVGFAFALRELPSLPRRGRALILTNVGIAIAFQMISLPYNGRVENIQLIFGDPLGSPHLMRLRNLYHVAKGDFEQRGLTYGYPHMRGKPSESLFNRGFGGGSILLRYIWYTQGVARALLMAAWTALLLVVCVICGAILRVVRRYLDRACVSRTRTP